MALPVFSLDDIQEAQNNTHYRVICKVSYRFRVGSQKRRVEISEGVRVDMMANQADEQQIWEIMES